MIKLNMSDVTSVLASCRTYLIALGVIVALAVVASIACMKVGKPLRGLIRRESWWWHLLQSPLSPTSFVLDR